MFINILLLVLATAIWGYGFVATRLTLVLLDPYWANALRFVVAGVCSLPFLFYKKSFTRKNNIIKKSFISSIFLLGILLFQTIGLGLTTVAKSGFITTFYIFFIPIITMVVFKKRYRLPFWLLTITAMLGMALMSNLEFTDLNVGDFYTLICAFCSALHIMYVGKVANHIESPIEFNFLQNFFVAIMSVIIAFLMKGRVELSVIFDFRHSVLMGLLYLGIFSSMISFTVQIIAQKKIPDHIAGLIFLMEAPFAALFGHLSFNEGLTTMNLIGASVILISVLLVPVLGRQVTAQVKCPNSH